MKLDIICRFLIERVEKECELPPGQLRIETPLAAVGVSSIALVRLCGEVEERFGIDLPPELVFDHPTIHALAQAIAARMRS